MLLERMKQRSATFLFYHLTAALRSFGNSPHAYAKKLSSVNFGNDF